MIAALLLAGGAVADGKPTEADLKGLKKIWHTLSPAEQEAYVALARERARRAGGGAARGGATAGEDCASASPEMDAGLIDASDDTTGLVDDLNLSDELLSCAGGGLQFATTGLGPDIVYKFSVDTQCGVQITMTPTGPDDLALYVVEDNPNDAITDPCATDLFSACVAVDDAGDAGDAEDVAFLANFGRDYYIVVDGFNGDSGPFTLEMTDVTGDGCALVPVRLQHFSVD